jgi:predicted dehydrogenase
VIHDPMARPWQRRTFLSVAGPLAAAAWGANSRIRIGIIGCGAAGRRNLAAVLADPTVECPVICDVDDSQLAAALRIPRQQGRPVPEAVKDFRRVLDRADVDAVAVCTPDHWHALQTVLACLAGKDVYLETPLATTIAEGRAIIDAAKAHGRVVQVGAHWRSGKHYQDAANYVRSGKLGRIRQTRAWAHMDSVVDIGNRLEAPAPAGVDYDLGLAQRFNVHFTPIGFTATFAGSGTTPAVS